MFGLDRGLCDRPECKNSKLLAELIAAIPSHGATHECLKPGTESGAFSQELPRKTMMHNFSRVLQKGCQSKSSSFAGILLVRMGNTA